MKALGLEARSVFGSFRQVQGLAACQQVRHGWPLSFRLARPRDRFGAAPVNPALRFAEALQLLWAQNDETVLTYYRGAESGTTPIWSDNYEMCRIFDEALDRLTRGSETDGVMLRAPGEPRAIGLHLVRRAERLDCACFVHASDIADELAADVFLCTFAHEFAARSLNLEMGTYAHHVNSVHVVSGVSGARSRIHSSMPPMPAGTSWDTVQLVGDYEDALRRNALVCAPEDLRESGLEPYWRQVILLFEAQREIVFEPDSQFDVGVFTALAPVYQDQLSRVFPERVPKLCLAAG